MNKVFVSWSGGKDSHLALLKAQESGLKVATLVTFFRDNERSNYHRVKAEIIRKQAEAMGIKLEAEEIAKGDNGHALLRVMEKLKPQGIAGGVFGDINISAHREWVEWVCTRGGLTMHMPLWGMPEERVLAELQERGCKQLIVAVRHRLIDLKWLGRTLDEEFTRMCIRSGLSLCGERGEFHTLAFDGPLFREPLQILAKKVVIRRKSAFLDLSLK